MRFYQQQHPYYCGIDLHARTMHVCGDRKVTAAEPPIDIWCDAPARGQTHGPGEMTLVVEPHRSDPQPEQSQNSVNEMRVETFS